MLRCVVMFRTGRVTEISAMTIELTAQLYPFYNRLCDFVAADLAFVMRRDQTIEELIVACDERIQEVSKRAGKLQRLEIRKLWKIKSSKSKAKKRAYRYGLYLRKRIGACFKSGDQFGVTGPVINARNIAPKGKGNRKPRTAMQKAAARTVAKVLGKQRSTDKQKAAAKKTGQKEATEKQRAAAHAVGKQEATETQKAAAKKTDKVVGQQEATTIQKTAATKTGQHEATTTQKNAAKKTGKQEATERQKSVALAVGKQEATETQKAAATKTGMVVGHQGATATQKSAAKKTGKVVGKQEATEKQKAAAKKIGKRAASNSQKEAVARSNKVRRIRRAHVNDDVARIGIETAE